jgi:signal transduction histidine kinase
MITVLALALLGLFAVLAIMEMLQHETAVEAASSGAPLERLEGLYMVLNDVEAERMPGVLRIASSCHSGFSVSPEPFARGQTTVETQQLQSRLAKQFALSEQRINVTQARLSREDFSYWKCPRSEIDVPVEAEVISLRLDSGAWLNAEVHAHEWHWREKLDWMMRAAAAFVFVGGIAIFFMRRLNRPLNRLTDAAQRFGAGLQVAPVPEDGPIDLQRAIRSFNEMQRQVADELARRTSTLAAISHDVRTPLTALRIKTELIDDAELREDMIASINRMETITASALEFLQGGAHAEPMRCVDLSELLESECQEFAELGQPASFNGAYGIRCNCRPDALARAVRNLIDNGIKYGGAAEVALRADGKHVEISVADNGPGIAPELRARALRPFERLSQTNHEGKVGFGLGLAVAQAVAAGHGGEIILDANRPTGLIAKLRFPAI